MNVAALAGGVGGAKFLQGLARLDASTTAIVNTGDDATLYGVHVSPDLDIVTYWLAGLADTERGWGLKGDTFTVVEALGGLGEENWFSLGDRDFATCLVRSQGLRAGRTLSHVTDDIRESLGISMRLLPMSDDRVSTRLVTTSGTTLEFQEYFVKLRQGPDISDVSFDGVADAKPAPGVIEAIQQADKVIICPSNPILSIAPILALGEVRNALVEHDSVTAISPIIRGQAIKGPAARLLASMGWDVSAAGVAAGYADFVDLYVVDETDPEELDRVGDLGIEAVALDTVMKDADVAEALARALL